MGLIELRRFLIRIRQIEDFGHEFYINLLNLDLKDEDGNPTKWSAIPIALRWDLYPNRPVLSTSVGGYSLIAASFQIYKLAFSFSFIPLFKTYELDGLDF